MGKKIGTYYLSANRYLVKEYDNPMKDNIIYFNLYKSVRCIQKDYKMSQADVYNTMNGKLFNTLTITRLSVPIDIPGKTVMVKYAYNSDSSDDEEYNSDSE